MTRIDNQASLPTYSYRSLDGKLTGPRKTRLLKNLLGLLVIGCILLFLFVKYFNITFYSVPGAFQLFRKSSTTTGDIPKFDSVPIMPEAKDKSTSSSTQDKPLTTSTSSEKSKTSPVTIPEKYKAGSPLDAFLSGFVDPVVASQMLKFLAGQIIDPIVLNLAPVLDSILPPERINLILRTTNSIASGELSGLDAIRRNLLAILESFILLLLNLVPEFGKEVVNDIVTFCDLLSHWMEHADLSIAKYLGQFVAYGILPFFGYNGQSLDQASRIFENGFSQLLPDISMLDSSLFKSKEKLANLIPPLTKIQPVVMSMFVQLASLKALQASVSSFSGSKNKEEVKSSISPSSDSSVDTSSSQVSSEASETKKRHNFKKQAARHRRKEPSSESEDSFSDS